MECDRDLTFDEVLKFIEQNGQLPPGYNNPDQLLEDFNQRNRAVVQRNRAAIQRNQAVSQRMQAEFNSLLTNDVAFNRPEDGPSGFFSTLTVEEAIECVDPQTGQFPPGYHIPEHLLVGVNQHIQAESNSPLTDAVNNNVAFNKPAKLLASDVRHHIRTVSKARLRDAVQKRVPLDALYFTDDCYPAWDGIHEMNSGCNHHARVQRRLLNHEVAGLVDPLIMKKLVHTANQKLEEARLLGLALADIKIGADLVPEWTQEAVDVAVPLSQTVEDYWEDEFEQNVETFGAEFVDKIYSEALEENAMITSWDSDESLTTHLNGSSSGDGESQDGDDQDGESDDNRYAMFSGGDLQPLPLGYSTIAEGDDEAENILPDVEIQGGPDGTYHVDMEV
ncbi:hypothetical protein HDV63DRAFT_413260 [Trichoderma sp. SZMC 28014]